MNDPIDGEFSLLLDLAIADDSVLELLEALEPEVDDADADLLERRVAARVAGHAAATHEPESEGRSEASVARLKARPSTRWFTSAPTWAAIAAASLIAVGVLIVTRPEASREVAAPRPTVRSEVGPTSTISNLDPSPRSTVPAAVLGASCTVDGCEEELSRSQVEVRATPTGGLAATGSDSCTLDDLVAVLPRDPRAGGAASITARATCLDEAGTVTQDGRLSARGSLVPRPTDDGSPFLGTLVGSVEFDGSEGHAVWVNVLGRTDGETSFELNVDSLDEWSSDGR